MKYTLKKKPKPRITISFGTPKTNTNCINYTSNKKNNKLIVFPYKLVPPLLFFLKKL